MCWRRSSRGCDSWLTHGQDSHKRRLLAPTPVAWTYMPTTPTVGTVPSTEPWAGEALLRPYGQYMWLTEFRSLYKLLLWFGGSEWRSAYPVAAQDQPCTEVRLLLKPPTYHYGVVCLLLWSLRAVHVQRPLSDFTWQAPNITYQQSNNYI